MCRYIMAGEAQAMARQGGGGCAWAQTTICKELMHRITTYTFKDGG